MLYLVSITTKNIIFLEQYNILKTSLQNISKELKESGFRVKDFA